MSYATIDDLRSQLGRPMRPAGSAADMAYAAKMLHPLPTAPTVDRAAFLVAHSQGKRVLEFGASGHLTAKLRAVASAYAGVDRESQGDIRGCDLDDVTATTVPAPLAPEILICGEVLEHLANPGWFLTRLHRQFPGVPLIVTVPNAFSAIAQAHLARGIENVNRDHVAWYSPTTLATLLSRAGYRVGSLAYYHGSGPTAEGLIVCAE